MSYGADLRPSIAPPLAPIARTRVTDGKAHEPRRERARPDRSGRDGARRAAARGLEAAAGRSRPGARRARNTRVRRELRPGSREEDRGALGRFARMAPDRAA